MAKAAILIEDGWAAIWPATMVTGALLLLVLLGIPATLSDWLRYAMFACFAAAFTAALRPVLKLQVPDDARALRRIEQRSGLRNRPATAWSDRLANPDPDSSSRAIWQVHKQRAANQLKGLQFGWPRSLLPRLDPYASRNTLAIALVAAGVLNWGQWQNRVAMAVNPAQSAIQKVQLDAWIAPPAYTGKPPILLSGEIGKSRFASQSELLVPDGSMLVVRLNGAKTPRLVLSMPTEDGGPGDELSSQDLAASENGGTHELRFKLERPVHAAIKDDSRKLDGWSIAIIPDAPPDVELTGKLAATPSGGFAVPWQASDDYGISGIAAQFKLAGGDAEKVGKNSLQFDPPQSPVDLKKLNPLKADGRTFMDFTAHPWAGMSVELRLRATDQAAQPGLSDPLVFKLPEREFNKLLAQALVEQRRHLVRYPGEKGVVVRALTGLMAWPEGLFESSAHYLGMRLVAARLYEARNPDHLKDVVELMWDLAISIEDGDLSDALKKLEALRKELQKALAEGAPEERIAELVDQMRQALDEYLQAMAREMQKAMKNGDQMQADPVDPNQMIQSQDLQKMLDMIENLAKSGARDAAQEMLSQLEDMMKNLRMGTAQQANPQDGSAMQKMLQELGEMMQRQQQLMDETFRMPDGQNGDMQQQQRPGDQSSQNSRQGDQKSDLAGQQRALERMLDQLRQQLGQQGIPSPGGLERSQGAMRDATGALREGDRPNALTRQGEAMDGLREGAQNMAPATSATGHRNRR